MPAVDLKRLAAEISVQHGIRVDPDDPIMAVVTLNRLMLETAVAEVVENLQSATRDLQGAAEKVQSRAGARLARDIRECAAAIQDELRASGPSPHKPAEISPDDSRAGSPQRWFRQLVVAGVIFLA